MPTVVVSAAVGSPPTAAPPSPPATPSRVVMAGRSFLGSLFAKRGEWRGGQAKADHGMVITNPINSDGWGRQPHHGPQEHG